MLLLESVGATTTHLPHLFYFLFQPPRSSASRAPFLCHEEEGSALFCYMSHVSSEAVVHWWFIDHPIVLLVCHHQTTFLLFLIGLLRQLLVIHY